MFGNFFRNSKRRVIRSLYDVGYRSLVSRGAWRPALMHAVALDPGERVVEFCQSIEGVSADLAIRHPLARVCYVQTESGTAWLVPSTKSSVHSDGRSSCDPAAFDKAISTFALHMVPDKEKLRHLGEIRRVLRPNGTLYVVELDQGKQPSENILLRAAATQFGADSVRAHLDGNWVNLVRQAGFTSLKRLEDFSITIGRIALIRARKA